jgi:large subunit ribosomal protein L6
MSRIGKKPVEIPESVSAAVQGQKIEISGPNGSRSFQASDDVSLEILDKEINVKPRDGSKRARQQWGMNRTQIANLVTGVTVGFSKELELRGVGYRASLQGDILKLALGYSHDVEFKVPAGIKILVPTATSVVISGIDQQIVGQIAAKIREKRKPEPYKGKGIRYKGEYVFAKEGKKK